MKKKKKKKKKGLVLFLFVYICRTRSNRSGGIQGGISNGENIILRVAFKPTSTIGQEQRTVSRDGSEALLRGKGRHDPCVLPRAVPIVEAMVAVTLLDALMVHHGQNELFPRSHAFTSGSGGALPNILGKKLNLHNQEVVKEQIIVDDVNDADLAAAIANLVDAVTEEVIRQKEGEDTDQ